LNRVGTLLESAWFQPLNRKCDILVSDFANFLSSLTCTATLRGTEWEETCEELAEDDDEDGAKVYLEGRVVKGSEAILPALLSSGGGEGTFMRHLVWLSPGTALVTVDRPTGASILALLKLEGPRRGGSGGRDRDIGWSVILEASVDLPAPALRVTATEGTAGATHHGAFVQLQGQRSTPLWVKINANVNIVCSRVEGALQCEKVNEKMTLAVSPVSWEGGMLPVPCAVARTIPAPNLNEMASTPEMTHSSAADQPPLLLGLDGAGALRCGSRVVAAGVRSFGVHWSAPAGAVAAGRDAPVGLYTSNPVEP
jgi:hypothetical protein